MAELTINELIKLIIGILVVVAVVVAVYIVFKDHVLEFIKGIPSGEPEKILLALVWG